MIITLYHVLTEYWLPIIWGAGVILAYLYGGKYAALLVATLGFGSIMYNRGKSEQNEKAKKIEDERKNAYKEIDNRGTDRDDVIDRLHKNNF